MPNLALAVTVIVAFGAAHIASALHKLSAPQWLKGAVTWLFGALAGILPTIAWAPGVSWTTYVWHVALALATIVVTHYTGVTTPVANATRNFGITASPLRSELPPYINVDEIPQAA